MESLRAFATRSGSPVLGSSDPFTTDCPRSSVVSPEHIFTKYLTPDYAVKLPWPSSSCERSTSSRGSSPSASEVGVLRPSSSSSSTCTTSPFIFSGSSSPATTVSSSGTRGRSLSPSPTPKTGPDSLQVRTPSPFSSLSEWPPSLSYKIDETVHMPPLFDVASEKPQHHQIFNKDFQDRLQAGRELALSVAHAIRGIPKHLSDQDLDKVLADAQRLSTSKHWGTKKIAIYGDADQGKSGLINSLLRTPGIADLSDADSACTSIITEYRPRRGGQTEPILIQVEFLPPEDIREVVDALLGRYRRVYQPGLGSTQTTAADEHHRAQRASDEAWVALEASFGHQAQFNQRTLRDQTPGAHERLRAQLVEWTQTLNWTTGTIADKLRTATAKTVEECARKKAMLTHGRYRPFIKVLRIFTDAPLLRAGVVLVDLPSPRGTNSVQFKLTQDYLAKYNDVLVVSSISRAIPDPFVMSSLSSILARNKTPRRIRPEQQQLRNRCEVNVSVICTKSEDMDLDAAKHQFVGFGNPISSIIVAQLEVEMAQAKVAGDHTLRKQLKHQLESLFIQARNSHVQQQMQKSYSARFPDGKLDVFCVSSKLYEKQCREGDADLVALSGIPRLRSACALIAADAQLDKGRRFLDSSLPALLDSLRSWVAKTNSVIEASPAVAHAKDRFCGDVNTLPKAARKDAIDLTLGLSSSLKEHILKFADQRKPFWTESAKMEAQKWTTPEWTHAQYSAWCEYGGHWWLKDNQSLDWNAAIIWKMRSELEIQWTMIKDEVLLAFEKLLKRVEELVSSITTQRCVLEAITGDAHLRFQTWTRVHLAKFRQALESQRDILVKDIELNQKRASKSHGASYIVQAMESFYRDAFSQSGPGAHARQLAIIGGRVADEGLFDDICNHIQGSHQAALDTTRLSLFRSVARLADALKLGFNSILGNIARVRRAALEKEMREVQTVVDELVQRASRLQGTAEGNKTNK